MITDFTDKIFCGDSLSIMRELPDGCCDIAITSPPYNLKNSTGNGMKDGRGGKWSRAALINGYADYNDNMPYDLYCKWQRECLSEMMRLIVCSKVIFRQNGFEKGASGRPFQR